MENRKSGVVGAPVKSSPLPSDFLKMVQEVFTANFDEQLTAYGKLRKNPRFAARGEIFAEEIVLAISLLSDDTMAGTTLYASVDFDPKASSPKAEDLLNLCVDAIGSVFQVILTKENLEAVADESLSALNNVPFDWAETTVEKKRLYVKIDKSNPELDQMADDWLSKNDPDYEERLKREHEETENLFVAGPKGPGKPTVH